MVPFEDIRQFAESLSFDYLSRPRFTAGFRGRVRRTRGARDFI